MKKLIATLVILATCLLSLASCFGGEEEKQIRIGVMAGPTAMGMAKLIADNGGTDGNEKYSFTVYQDTATAKADLTKGDVDIICLPTNEAAAYYKTVDDDVRVLAINCLNSLFVISDKDNSATQLSDLVGKTVYTCKNGTPKMVLDYIIEELDLDITVSTATPDGKEMATPADVRAQVVNGALPFAVIPEPMITAAQLAIQKAGKANEISYSVDIDLGDEWAKISPDAPVAMGCIVSTEDFTEDNEKLVASFLTEYKASIEFIGNLENLDTSAQYIADAGIMAAAPAAKKALSNLGDAISYIDGADMKTTLEGFFTATGLPKPDGEFYYD